MDDLDRQLRDAFDEPAPLTFDEIRAHTGGTAPRNPRRRATLVGVVVALIAIAGGVGVLTTRDTNHNPRVAVGATSTSSSATASTTTSSNAASGHATVSIVLDRTTAPADGSPIRGQAIVDNETGHVIDAPSGQCVTWLAVGLSNAQIPFDFATPAIACAPFEIPKGKSRYPVTVSTQYTSCLMPGGSGDSEVPACIGPDHNETPPLPPGTYEARVYGPPAAIELPPPTTVTLTPASG